MKRILIYVFLLYSVSGLCQPYQVKHSYLFAPIFGSGITRDVTEACTGVAGVYADSVCVISISITNTMVTAMVASKTNGDFLIDWGKTTIAIDENAPELCRFISKPGCRTHINTVVTMQFAPLNSEGDIFKVLKYSFLLPEENIAENIGRKIIITLNGEFDGKAVSYRLPFKITSFQVN
jgi:hypothetical protein